MQTDEQLLIDLGATTIRPDPSAIREWASTKRVFISSVMAEFATERRVLAEAIRAFGAQPVLFEEFGGREDDSEVAYVSEVHSSDIYVGILGRRYGRPNPPHGFSATHTEYFVAERDGLRLSIWVMDVPDREGHENSFLEEVRVYHVTGSFSDGSELATKVTQRLTEICAEELTPWVKARTAVFRASQVRDTGGTLHITGRVVDDVVVSSLEALRGRVGYGAGRMTRISTAGRSREAQVTSVQLVRTARRGADVEIEATIRDENASWMRATYQENGVSYSPEELVDWELRRAVFGETPPFKYGVSRLASPWRAIEGMALSHAVLPAVLSLLIAEELGRQIPGSELPHLRLGPARNKLRRCVLEWQEPRPTWGTRPKPRRVEGDVRLM
jgi:Domain of unknown function (DUF4062)